MTTLAAEFRRTFSLARSYWIDYVFDLILYSLGFLLLMAIYFVAADGIGPELYLSILIGYVTWKVCASTMAKIARTVVDEAKTGTLEQLFLTGKRPGYLLLLRGLSIFLNDGIRGFVLGTVLAGVLGVFQPISLLIVIIFTLTAAGAIGLGFCLAGLALVHKRIGGFLNLIWQMLVFFSGALAPITNPVLGTFSKMLPLSWGIEAMRAVMVEHQSVIFLWDQGQVLGLLINTGFYVVMGGLIFRWGIKQAKTLGVLGQY